MNNLLNKEEYVNDKLRFWFVDQNRKLDTAYVNSDDETYAVVQGKDGLPVWAWTLENLSLDKLKEVKDALTKFVDRENVNVTSREELYNYLVSTNYEYLDKDSYFELGFLECFKPVKPDKCDGYLDRVRTDELDLLAEYYYLDRQELPLESVTKEEAYEKSKELLNDENFYVWRNSNDKLVAYLNYSECDKVARLGNVYTVPDERRKGYCSNLVYEVTKGLKDKGYRVFLYTDYKYPNSNGAYKKVGYEDKGFLVQYNLKRK